METKEWKRENLLSDIIKNTIRLKKATDREDIVKADEALSRIIFYGRMLQEFVWQDRYKQPFR